MFVATNTRRDNKHDFVATKVLSWQTLLSRQIFVLTDTCLSQQTRVCRDKTFVATKIILVVAPANDIAPRNPVPPVIKDCKYKCIYSLCRHWVSSETESDTGVRFLPDERCRKARLGGRKACPRLWVDALSPKQTRWPVGLQEFQNNSASRCYGTERAH